MRDVAKFAMNTSGSAATPNGWSSATRENLARTRRRSVAYYEVLNSAPWVDYFKQAGRETLEGSFSAVSTPIFASK